jgi:hypothetical protein
MLMILFFYSTNAALAEEFSFLMGSEFEMLMMEKITFFLGL